MVRFYLALLCILLISCTNKQENPELFLPSLKSAEGVDLSSLRSKYCSGLNIWFDEGLLTPENFRSVFNCANYDSSLEPLKPLLTNTNFPDFLKNMNLILKSDGTKELKQTLKSWLEEGTDGTSRIDRLLPTLSKIIKNPSFQAALPVFSNILQAGLGVWNELLPGMADLIYQPRFPDNYADILTMFDAESAKSEDAAKSAKDWARFIKTKVNDKTIALRVLELGNKSRNLQLPGTTVFEYLDQLNVKGVVASLYQETGELRGEKINPKLNADPDEEEIENGWNLTPEERQERAKRKLFTRGEDGSDAPIVQLAGLVNEFHQPHADFIPAIARWVAANGATISDGFFDYISKTLVINSLTKINLEIFLSDYAAKSGIDLNQQISGSDFSQFLKSALGSNDFSAWSQEIILQANKEFFGEKNAELLLGSNLKPDFLEIYNLPEVSEFAHIIIPGDKKITLASAVKRFSNLHRGEKLKVSFRGKVQSIEPHVIDIWQLAAKKYLGESIVVKFTIELVQTLFSEFASDFASKNLTIAQWYFSSTYGSPDSSEALAGYAFKELGLMEKYKEHKEYLKTTFAKEVFPNENDQRAFITLVDQIPNIWIYIKSGSSRSGNDLTRALSSKDQGYLINNYVNAIASAYQLGLIKDGVLIIEEYFKQFASTPKVPVEDNLENRRKLSKGTDALKRVLSSLFEPEEVGNYHSSTFWQLLQPLGAIVSEEKIDATEKFVLASADEILNTSNKTINDFFRDYKKEQFKNDSSIVASRENMKAISELLKKEDFPAVVFSLNSFFQDDAVRPALDFLARKIDDGTLSSVLLFIRRVLGFVG